MGAVQESGQKAGTSVIGGVVGHAEVIDLLARSLDRGRIAHAYLFSGPGEVGKRTVARAFAGALLGDDAPLDRHPDFIFVERNTDPKTGVRKTGITIEQIRDLRGRLAMGAFMNGWRAAIIDDAHLMNVESANALLKSLEEPHPRTLLILIASSDDAVLPTIRSRCQVIRFGRVSTDRIVAALGQRGVAGEEARLYARLADGRPGRAFALADGRERLADMRELREQLLGMLDASLTDRVMTMEKLVPQKLTFIEAGERAGTVLELLGEVLRDAVMVLTDHAEGAIHVDVLPRIAAFADRSGAGRVVAALELVERARRLIRENVNPRAALEHVALGL